MTQQEYKFYEEDIRKKRHLPYTISVEKIEGELIYCHNQWGTDMTYKKIDDGYELLEE